MAEVKRSTSQGASVRGDANAADVSYDLNSWQGLTAVLQAGREASLDAGTYAEFRNLVLEYAQKRGDKKLREQIESVIQGFTSKAKTESLQEKEKKSIPGDAVSTPVPEPSQATPPSLEVKIKPTVTPPANHAPITRRPVQSFIPHKYAGDQVVEESPKEAVPYESAPETELPQEVKASAAPTADVQPTPDAPLELKSTEEYRARITEIKRTVNAQLKNPIALVDDGNQIGRAYMSALLGAMKATSAGSPDDPHVAMRVLEEAFKKIEAYVSEHGKEEEKKVKPPQEAPPLPPPEVEAPALAPEAEQQAATETEAHKEVLSQPEKPSEPVQQSEPPTPDERHEHEGEIVIPAAPEPAQEEPVEEKSPDIEPIPAEPKAGEVSSPNVIQLDEIVTPPVPTPPAPKEGELVQETNELKRKLDEAIERARSASFGTVVRESAMDETEKKQPVAPMPTLNVTTQRAKSPVRRGIPSLRDLINEQSVTETTAAPDHTTSELENVAIPPIESAPSSADIPEQQPPQPHTSEIIQPPKQHAVGTLVQQSELASAEVNEALTQLLHQWSIFASSGIFGIGPGGIEHPLYMKLSKLTMGEVVAGRWDNADPEVTRIIKDYIDAWRHEQGVAYNPTETFEHYLRRVVQRIIRRQRGEAVV